MKFLAPLIFLFLATPAVAAPVTSGALVEVTDDDPAVDEFVPREVETHKPRPQNPLLENLGKGVGFDQPKPKTKKRPRPKAKIKSHWVPVGSYKGSCRRDNLYEMKKVLSLVNRHRIRNGRGSLKISKGCNAFASYIGGRNSREAKPSWALHFNEMKNQREVRSVLRKNGLSRGVGENIAWGQPGAGICSGEDAVRGWINSPGHNANMLRSGWKYMGIARVVGRNGIVHWTQCFH